MAVNKTIIIGCVASVIVVVASAAGGAVFISRMESSNVDSTMKVSNVEGKMQFKEEVEFTGWKQKGNDWYYFKNDIGQVGWIQDNNNWYYLNEDGTRAINTVVDGYHLNKDGIRVDTTDKKASTEEYNQRSVDNGFTYEDALRIVKSSGMYSDPDKLIGGNADYPEYQNGKKYYTLYIKSKKLLDGGGSGTAGRLKVFEDGTVEAIK